LEWERLAGKPAVSAPERFERWYAKDAPAYFIVEDVHEFAQQPDLERFLSRFPIVAKSPDYVIFSLAGS
jgi:hypothetical protein